MVAIKTPGGGAPAYLDLTSGGVFLRGTSVRAMRAAKQLVIRPAPRSGQPGERRDHGKRPPALWPRTLMTLAGFCRNCFAKWYRAAAEERGIEMDYEAAREIVYGMPYGEWKSKHQAPASPEQQTAYEESKQRFPEAH